MSMYYVPGMVIADSQWGPPDFGVVVAILPDGRYRVLWWIREEPVLEGESIFETNETAATMADFDVVPL